MQEIINLFRTVLDWSEVWAPLIPLIYLLFNKNQPRALTPVISYLLFAFLINLAGDIISDFKVWIPWWPKWLHSNNPLYNVHSIIRFIFFSYFFIALRQSSFTRLRHILPYLSLLIVIINFKYVENFGNRDHLSGNLLASEAYLLLIYCMLYYLSKLRDEENDAVWGPDFWVVTGLSIYVVVNFFVFLFYVPMIYQNARLADNMWDVHNIAYIIFCLFITRAFYEPARHQYSI
jgi:hypothetical protein